jgi:hydroxymethylpyrimidine pyrophosphatase-like HAD family hydrolase
MDGTLLDNERRLSPVFFDIYRQLEPKNIIFAVSFERQYYSLLKTFSPVKDHMMFIAKSGTLVMHQGK